MPQKTNAAARTGGFAAQYIRIVRNIAATEKPARCLDGLGAVQALK